MRVEPDAVTVRALIDLNPVPFAGDQIVAALGALHVVRLAFTLGGGPHDRRVLLPQQLGIATREVLVLVLARTIVRHGAGGGAGGGRICSLSPPGLATATRPGGDDASPGYRSPSHLGTRSTTIPSLSVTTSMEPLLYSLPILTNRSADS